MSNITRTLLPGLHFKRDGEKWSITIDSIDVIRAAVGDPLTNAFVRSLGVVDRLHTIIDCMYLSNTHAGGEADSIRSRRNLHVLGMFATGLVFEAREGFAQLRDAGVADHLSPHGLTRWNRLLEIATLQHEDIARQIRNCLAFHLGSSDVVQEGLDHLRAEPPPEPLILVHGDSSRSIDNEHPFITDVIAAGIRIRPHDVPPGTPNGRRRLDVQRDFLDVLTEASRSHFRIVRLLDEVFFDCLRNAGADINPPPPLEDEKEDDDA